MASEQIDLIMNQVQQLSAPERLELIKRVAEAWPKVKRRAKSDISSTANIATPPVVNRPKTISSWLNGIPPRNG